MGTILEAVAYLVALCASAFLVVTFLRNDHKFGAASAAICGLTLAAHRFALPSSLVDLETQFRLWTPFTAILMMLVAALFILLLLVNVGDRRERIIALVASVLLCAAVLLPLHRPHFGWSDHAHFIWESPYHVH